MKLIPVNPLNLSDRNVLVTGASSGIGRETAVLLSALGARVILVARRKAELLKTREMMVGEHHEIEVFDLSDLAEISNWMKSIAMRTGKLYGLVHSAGIQITQPVRFVCEEDVHTMLAINVSSAIFLAKAFRQKGVNSGSSSIVFLSSVGGMIGRVGLVAYSASKGAIISLVKSLALEFAREKIRVNCVAPAYIQTAMLDQWMANLTDEQKSENIKGSLLGLGTPRDVANAIVFLLADAASWITGTTLVVDGGYTAAHQN